MWWIISQMSAQFLPQFIKSCVGQWERVRSTSSRWSIAATSSSLSSLPELWTGNWTCSGKRRHSIIIELCIMCFTSKCQLMNNTVSKKERTTLMNYKLIKTFHTFLPFLDRDFHLDLLFNTTLCITVCCTNVYYLSQETTIVPRCGLLHNFSIPRLYVCYFQGKLLG